MELSPGGMLGPYRLVERAGSGGMAEVWRAFQPTLERYVAVKVLPRHLAAQPGYVERFRQEALAISRLDHPNILSVFDFGEQDGFTYMVTPFVDGGTLSQRLGRPWPIEEALGVLEPLGAGLDYAHARGIVHRDVKPSNVLLSAEGRVVLGDFGVARVLEGTTELTQTGAIIGTPQYMAPEQVLGRPATGASDRYALGVVLYELLTGRTPYQAETPMAVALAHVHQPLPPPRTVNPALSEAVQAVLFKALAKEPTERYPSSRALAEALRRTLPGEPGGMVGRSADDRASVGRWPAVPLTRSRPAVTQTADRAPATDRTRWLGGALGLVALMAAASFLFSAGGDYGSRPTGSPTAPPAQTVAAAPTALSTAAAPTAPPTTASASPDPAAMLVSEADSLLARDLPGAVAKYQQALSRDERSALAHRQLGLALFFQGQHRDHLLHLEQATRLDSQDPTAWALLSASYYLNYRYDEVVQTAERAARLAPDSADTRAALALQSLVRADYAAASQQAGLALTANPTGPLVQWVDWLVSTINGDLERALVDARRMAQQQPRWASPRLLTGQVLRLQYDLDGARREYEAALALDSRLLWVHEGVGWMLLLQGRLDEAGQAFQTALQRDPRNADAVAGQGYLAFLRQDYQTSRKTFQRALDLNPRDAVAYAGLGWVQTYGDSAFEPAEASFRQALEYYPGYSSARRGLGITHYRRSQWQPALADFQTALELAPKDAENSLWIGLTLMQIGRLDEARTQLERAGALKPGDPTIQQALNELKRRGG